MTNPGPPAIATLARGALVTLLFACSCSTEAPPGPDLLGVYHLPSEEGATVVDAVNLQLDEDGTFAWTVEGCDYCSGDRGVWKEAGQALVLSPRSGTSLRWFHGVTFKFAVKEVRVEAGEGPGAIRVTGISEEMQEAFVQDWPAGRMCPNCDSGLGPDGFALCDDPLPIATCIDDN